MCENFLSTNFYLPNVSAKESFFFFYFVGCCFADRLVGCIRSTLEPSSLITFFLYNNKTNQPAALKDGVLRCSCVKGS